MSRAPARGISIVCVYNDAEVRADCLDRSIAAYTGDAEVDYIPIDNTRQTFSSAGAALNHGARQARHDIVFFAHQDVYLHSIDRLTQVGETLVNGPWGILGASGAPAAGGNSGRLRDRLHLVGSHAPSPIEVDSLDEVAVMMRRDTVLQHPLTEDPDLAWHAYAVEYGLRMRRLGFGVGAVDLGITHNSLSTNLDRLDAAHRRILGLYPDLAPVHTSCGVISRTGPHVRRTPLLAKHRWRLRWMQYSVRALRFRKAVRLPVVLSDIREEVDLLSFDEAAPLHVVNLDQEGGFVEFGGTALTLTRRGRPVVMSATVPADLRTVLTQFSPSDSVLVTDLTVDDLRNSRDVLEDKHGWVLGIQYGSVWLLGGPVTGALPKAWSHPRAVPFGSPGPHRVWSRL